MAISYTKFEENLMCGYRDMSNQGLMQNFDIKVDERTDRQRSERSVGKTKTIYPLTYFLCRRYNQGPLEKSCLNRMLLV